jgi:protein-S-isoprenylcysteine O-methyltransferase Ste14
LLIRRDPDETRHTWKTWITTTGGISAPFFFRPLDFGDDVLIGQILQVSGTLLQIAALVALNRSLGLLPAHRGIKSEGLYRFVRHPLYMAYVIAFAGYWINNMSAHNAIVAVLGTVFIVLRISCEEELLLNYQRYSDYASKTRWRLIPSIW